MGYLFISLKSIINFQLAGKIEKVKNKNEIGGRDFAGTEVYRERLEII